jgi:hypothetical protein
MDQKMSMRQDLAQLALGLAGPKKCPKNSQKIPPDSPFKIEKFVKKNIFRKILPKKKPLSTMKELYSIKPFLHSRHRGAYEGMVLCYIIPS